MADLKRTGKNNQKRALSVLVVPLLEANVLSTGSIYATLPARSVIQSVDIWVKTVSGTASSTLDVTANGAVVANEIAVTTAGVIKGTVVTTAADMETGGDIVVKAGSTTPANGAFVGELIVTYIALDKTTGEYTN